MKESPVSRDSDCLYKKGMGHAILGQESIRELRIIKTGTDVVN